MQKPIFHALLLTLVAWPALAQDDAPRPPTEVFRYAAVDTGSAVEIDWVVEDGYYLYRKDLAFESNSAAIRFGEVALPAGIEHEDDYFGKQQVYRDRFYVTIPYEVVGQAPEKLAFTIRSRGCWDGGICYLPQTWAADVPMAGTRLAAAPAAAPSSAKRGVAATRFGSKPSNSQRRRQVATITKTPMPRRRASAGACRTSGTVRAPAGSNRTT